MLFSKNNKKTGVVSILALALALVMMLVVCLTGCTDENAQATADSAKTAADQAKTAADQAKSAADTAKATADTAKATADAAITETQLNQKLADYLKTEDGVKASELANAISNAVNDALKDYQKKSDALTEAKVQEIVNSAIANLPTGSSSGVTMTEVTNAINSALSGYLKADALNDYAKKSDVNTAISNALTDYVTKTALTDALKDYLKSSALTEELENYYTAEAVDNLIENVVSGDIADIYINIEEWDKVSAIYYALQEGDTTVDAVLAGNVPENSTYADDIAKLRDNVFPAAFYDKSEGYTAGGDVENLGDFVDKYYNVTDADGSGTPGDSQADFALKLNAFVKVRDRKLSTVTGYYEDLAVVAANGVSAKEAAKAINEKLASVGTKMDVTADATSGEPVIENGDLIYYFQNADGDYIRLTLELDEEGNIAGDLATVFEAYQEAVAWAETYEAGAIRAFREHKDLYEAGDDPLTEEVEDDVFLSFNPDSVYYGLDSAVLTAAEKEAEEFAEFYNDLMAKQADIIENNPTIDYISIADNEDEEAIKELVGPAAFEYDDDTKGMYEKFSIANDGDMSAVMNDDYSLVQEYVVQILKLKFIRDQNLCLRQLHVEYLAFVDEKNVGRSSYEALDLAVIYVKYEQFVTDLTFEDVKKEGNEGFSFETIINDMKAEIAQRWEVLKAQLPVIGGGEDPTNP